MKARNLSRISQIGSCAAIVLMAIALLLAAPERSSAQAVEWLKQFSQGPQDQPGGVAADSTGIYVGGTTLKVDPDTDTGNYDGFLKKYSLTGDVLWYQPIATSQDDQVAGIAEHGSSIYVVGSTYGTFEGQVSAGDQDAFVTAFSADGTRSWTQQFGMGGPDDGVSIATDDTGVYVLWYGAAGGMVSKFSVTGVLIWTQQVEGLQSLASAGSGFYMTGAVSTGINSAASVLTRFDQDGNAIWRKQFTVFGNENASGVTASASGVYVVGFGRSVASGQSGDVDAYVAKFDSSGNLQWTQKFGTQWDDLAEGVAADDSGVFVSGVIDDGIPFGQLGAGHNGDAYIRRYDSTGSLQWTRQLGSSQYDEGTALALEANKGILFGFTRGQMTPDAISDGSDLFVASFCRQATSIFPGAISMGTAGGSTDVNVTAASDCAWTVESDQPWVTIAAPIAPGSGTLSLSVAINSDPPPRTAALTIAGRQFTITQDGTGCNYSLNPMAISVSAAAGSGQILISTTPGCPWTATTTTSWISFGTHSGAGNGVVQYSVQSNTSGLSRGGTISIAGLTVTVSQAGLGCTASLSPSSKSYDSAAHADSFTVVITPQCVWSAVSNADWITISSGATGSGNGTVNYSVAANSTISQRSGTITAAGQNFSVSQSRGAPAINTSGVVNNASFAAGTFPIAPGSIVAIFGTNLNDGSTVTSSSLDPSGKLVTTLGGATVRIGNILAPIFYSTPSQLGVQVPYELAGLNSVTATVTAGGLTSATSSTIVLTTAAPGIFTTNQAGTGAAAALHQDGATPITAQNPAHPGEVISLYATGLGILTPQLATGALAGQNATITTYTATVDNAAADVTFSGGAPGFVGLDQVNVKIPANARTAPDISVRLTSSNGRQSNTVTIPIGS